MGKASGERVNAFSVGFSGAALDELGLRRAGGEALQRRALHRVVGPERAFAGPARPRGGLRRAVRRTARRWARCSAPSSRASAACTRMLAGDGGDEIFGGNERYARDRIFGALPPGSPGFCAAGCVEPVLDRRCPDGGAERARPAPSDTRGGRAMIRTPIATLSRTGSSSPARRTRCSTPEFRASVDRDARGAWCRDHFGTGRATSELNRLLYVDLKVTIGDNDLLKVTRTAELAGVGVRSLPRPAARGAVGDPARAVQGPRAREAPPVQARVPRPAPRRGAGQAQARLRRAHGLVGEDGAHVPRLHAARPCFREGASSAAISAARRSSGCSRCSRRRDAVLRRPAVERADARALGPAPRRAPGPSKGRGVTPAARRAAVAPGLGWRASRAHRPSCAMPAARGERRMTILSYHRVNDERDPYFPSLPTAVFERQMAYVARAYRVLAADEAVERLAAGDVPRRRALHHLRRRLSRQPHPRRADPGAATGCPRRCSWPPGSSGTAGSAVVRPHRRRVQEATANPSFARPVGRGSLRPGPRRSGSRAVARRPGVHQTLPHAAAVDQLERICDARR